MFFDKRVCSFMSPTAITLKFKMCWFPDEASHWAEKLQTDVDLVPLIPDEDNNFNGSLVLDFTELWRHAQAKNSYASRLGAFVANFM